MVAANHTQPRRGQSILCWNYQGLAYSRAIRAFRNPFNTACPSFVYISQTKCNKDKMKSFLILFGFDDVFCVSKIGLSGDLALFWNNIISISLLSYSSGHNDVVINFLACEIVISLVFIGILC